MTIKSNKNGDIKESRNRLDILVLVTFILFVAIYLISSFFPDSFLWGINHLAYFDLPTRFVLIILVIVFTLPPVSSRIIDILEKFVEWHVSKFWKTIVFSLVIGCAGVFLFQHFSIVLDMYGDTTKITNYAASREWSISDVFNYKENEPLTYLSYKWIINLTGIDWKTAFYIVSIGSGGIFLVLLFLFVFYLKGSALWKILFVMLWIASGINQNFFGHMENYSLAYLFNFTILFLAYQLFTGKKMLSLLIIIFLIGIRVHLEIILLTPALVYAIFYSSKERFPKLQLWSQPKYVIGFVLFSLLIGIWTYFFHFQAYHYTTTEFEERAGKLFLPLINPLPAPHSYSLLSLNHLSDVVQEILYTTSPIAIFIIAIALFHFRKIHWSEPRVIFYLLASFYFLLFNFTINTIQSPPRDWDFVSLAAVPINFLAIALSAQLFQLVKEKSVQQKMLAFAIAPAILVSTIFYVNSDKEKVNARLRSIGTWTYKSYYYGSVYMINAGIRGLKDVDEKISERERILAELLPFKSGKDVELALFYEGLAYNFIEKKEYKKAMESFKTSLELDPYQSRPLRAYADVAMLALEFKLASQLYDMYNEAENTPVITDSTAVLYSKYAKSLSVIMEKLGNSGRAYLQESMKGFTPKIPQDQR
jgi:hypothetical protein